MDGLNAYEFKDEIDFRCGDGYILEGTKLAVCDENGSFGEITAKCVPGQLLLLLLCFYISERLAASRPTGMRKTYF